MNQRDVAKIAGVSSATISRVINNDPKVSEKTRIKVQKVIEKYSYVMNENARSLRLKQSKAIGFLISNFNNPFFVAAYDGLEAVCKKRGYNVIIGNTNEDPYQEKEAIDLFLRYQVVGIVGCFVQLDDTTITKIKRHNIHLVALDRRIKGMDTDTIEIDNIGGAREQVRYIAELGHTKIGVIHGRIRGDSPGEERLRGFFEEMKQQGIPVRKEYIKNAEFLEQNSYHATVELLKLPDSPTAIITHNNLMCIGAYKALKDLKVSIPKDVSLIGFDKFELSDYLEPSITLIDRSIEEMGAISAETIIERIEKSDIGEARRKILPIYLKVKNSCCKV